MVAWALSVPSTALYLSVISVLELEQGILQIQRRDAGQGAVLRTWMIEQVLPAFEGRVLLWIRCRWRCDASRRCTSPTRAPNGMA